MLLPGPAQIESLPPTYPISWFDTSLAGDPTLGAIAPIAFDSPFDKLIGSDFTISVDGKTVTVVTTGLYGLYLNIWWSWDASASGVAEVQIKQLNDNGAGNNPLYTNGASPNAVAALPNKTTKTVLALPPLPVAAGSTFQVNGVSNLDAGTVTLTTLDWLMIRVA